MTPEGEPSRRRPSFLGFWLGATAFAIAFILDWALAEAPDSPAIKGWAVLLMHWFGREAVVAVFALVGLVWFYVGTNELADDGWHWPARIGMLLVAMLGGAMAWRWFAMDRWVLGSLAVLLALPGLLARWRAPTPTA